MQVARIAILACVATVGLSAQEGRAHEGWFRRHVASAAIEGSRTAYPRIAFSACISGDVIIGAVINEAGRIADTMIDRSIHLLDAAALDAVRQWQFEPPVVNGRAGRLATTITVRFVIYDADAPAAPAGRTASPSGMPADFAVVYAVRLQAWVCNRTCVHGRPGFRGDLHGRKSQSRAGLSSAIRIGIVLTDGGASGLARACCRADNRKC